MPDPKWRRAGIGFPAVRLLLGGIFLYAGIQKILDPGVFAHAIHNYRILPEGLINVTAVALPWIEALVGACLLLGLLLPGAAVLSVLFLLIFFSALIFNLARGLNIDCGCFGSAGHAGRTGSMAWTLVRDGGLLCLSCYLLFRVFRTGTPRESGPLHPKENDDPPTGDI